MAKFEPNKFIVINQKHLLKVPDKYLKPFIDALLPMGEYLTDNNYIACNMDEPYAQQVLDIILKGETEKEEAAAESARRV